ncbi:MAG: sorbosone dehydrogenase family protein, partial [Vicinamibacterales bacterium]
FVNDMRGPLYSVSYDGKSVQTYVDVNAPAWGVNVQSQGRERGFQSFAFHPQFSQPGTLGFGKFYTFTDTANMEPNPDFRPAGAEGNTHDTVLLEWTAKTPAGATYDGGAPRELMRFEQPFANHNAGHITFNTTAAPGAADYGLLYMGVADGGSGGDPLDLAQSKASGFGKILRIDPLGKSSANGKYGIPANNPFVKEQGTLGEIYAIGVRNPQRFAWDPSNGRLFMSDIGQNTVEEISEVTAGADLGWNTWEASYKFVSREGVDMSNPRSDPNVTYPIAEWDQLDPILLQNNSSMATIGVVYRHEAIPALRGRILFGDGPSGEIFHVSADSLPQGGQDAIHRVLFRQNGQTKTLLQLIQEKATAQGREPVLRADLRFGPANDGRIFVLNKADSVVRMIVPWR